MKFKGSTSATTFESTIYLIHRLTPLLELPVVDPSEAANSFPFHVMALLPFMLVNYDDPPDICVQVGLILNLNNSFNLLL